MGPAQESVNPRFSGLLGRKLRAWRRFCGFTTATLGAHANISVDLLRQIEDGAVSIESTELNSLLAALDVGLYELLTSPGPANRARSATSPLQLPDVAATAEA